MREAKSSSTTRSKYRRRSRDGDDNKGGPTGFKHPSSAAGHQGPVSVAKAARPWEDIVEEMEEMNDSPTDSEALPAPQPRALGAGSAQPNEGKNVSLLSEKFAVFLLGRYPTNCCACKSGSVSPF